MSKPQFKMYFSKRDISNSHFFFITQEWPTELNSFDTTSFFLCVEKRDNIESRRQVCCLPTHRDLHLRLNDSTHTSCTLKFPWLQIQGLEVDRRIRLDVLLDGTVCEVAEMKGCTGYVRGGWSLLCLKSGLGWGDTTRQGLYFWSLFCCESLGPLRLLHLLRLLTCCLGECSVPEG